MKRNVIRLIISTAFIVVSCMAFGGEADVHAKTEECRRLDLAAIRFAASRKFQEAADAYDRAMKECPPDPSRMTSRGVLYAIVGQRKKAEALIGEAIALAESEGDYCRADLSRGELAVIRGGKKPVAPPESCKRDGFGGKKRAKD